MKKLNKQQIEEIKHLKNLPEEAIDASDIPEQTNWDNAVSGRFYSKKRSDFVLAILALQGFNKSFSPVQVQKLFFILDKEIPQSINGPLFNFKPYDYGPFDSYVYAEIEQLEKEGLAQVEVNFPYRLYRLTEPGFKQGKIFADDFSEDIKNYIKSAGSFVSRLSFQQLVSAVYRKYPEMRSKSVFRE